MKELYSPNLIGDRYFYYQNEGGLPVDRIPTIVDGVKRFCIIALTNQFNPGDWSNKTRDPNFIGNVWPLRRIDHFIGRGHIREVCAGCGDYDICGCTPGHCTCEPKACKCYYRTELATIELYQAYQSSLKPIDSSNN
jgi:hypothetical protein